MNYIMKIDAAIDLVYDKHINYAEGKDFFVRKHFLYCKQNIHTKKNKDKTYQQFIRSYENFVANEHSSASLF